MPVRVFLKALAVIALVAAVTGCAREIFTSRVTDVREEYAATWDGRLSRFQAELAGSGAPVEARIDPKTKAPLPAMDRDLTGLGAEQAARLGRLDTMAAFKAFRQSEPVMSVARKWVRESADHHVVLLRTAGFDNANLLRVLQGEEAENEQLTKGGDPAIAYHKAALRELRQISGELARFDVAYHAALRTDLANMPPATRPMSGAELQGLTNAITAGAYIGAGVR